MIIIISKIYFGNIEMKLINICADAKADALSTMFSLKYFSCLRTRISLKPRRLSLVCRTIEAEDIFEFRPAKNQALANKKIKRYEAETGNNNQETKCIGLVQARNPMSIMATIISPKDCKQNITKVVKFGTKTWIAFT